MGIPAQSLTPVLVFKMCQQAMTSHAGCSVTPISHALRLGTQIISRGGFLATEHEAHVYDVEERRAAALDQIRPFLSTNRHPARFKPFPPRSRICGRLGLIRLNPCVWVDSVMTDETVLIVRTLHFIFAACSDLKLFSQSSACPSDICQCNVRKWARPRESA